MVLEQPDIHVERNKKHFFTFTPVSAMDVWMDLAKSLVISFSLLIATVGEKNNSILGNAKQSECESHILEDKFLP